MLLRAGIPPHGEYLCFALRRWRGFEEKAPLFAAAAEYAYRTYGLTPVFVSVEKHLDPGAGRLAAQGLRIPHYFLDDAGGRRHHHRRPEPDAGLWCPCGSTP